MEITKEQFEAYERVRVSGVTNMWDMKRVSKLSKLSRDVIYAIMARYEDLMNKYKKVS